jgi:hypothetical protein
MAELRFGMPTAIGRITITMVTTDEVKLTWYPGNVVYIKKRRDEEQEDFVKRVTAYGEKHGG